MAIRTAVRAGTVPVNRASIYHEVRGSGPPLLLIVGATGDSGWYAPAAERLARHHTVVTYDRRGNSRSSAPEGWTATSIEEQADDAAGLLRALGLAPAAAFGSSGGAVILLDLIVRHPEVLRGALVHEPPTMGVLPPEEAEPLGIQLRAMVEEGMAAGGPREALRRFMERYAGGGYRRDEAMLERVLGNAEVFLGLELTPFASYLPDVEAVRRSGVPVVVLAGEESRDSLPETYGPSRWLADQLGTDLREIPGAHVPYFDRPDAFVEAVRPFLKAVT